MKKLLLIFLLFPLIAGENVEQLLCHKWIQISYRAHNEVNPRNVDASQAKSCSFNADGTYSETMYNNTFKATGNWALDSDKKKFGLSLRTMNGLSVPVSTGEIPKNTIILKLTKDTLIYGNEGYYGKNYTYGHNDWYFVRAK
jgi:hypothetical protein